MNDFLPAWSDVFHTDPAPAGPGVVLPPAITSQWAYGDRSGRGVRVAVVDSGIQTDHPRVGPVTEMVAVERDHRAEKGTRIVVGPHDDLYGHGTACAGIIHQLAPEAKLISVRVLGEELKGSARVFAAGLDWCIRNNIHIINLSMSTSSADWAPVFWDLVDQAVQHHICVVSAMNNEHRRTIPSEFAGVFSVACAPGKDRERLWCNPTAPAEWGAAGIDVEVAWAGGTSLVATGNSFAAPVVAGHLARLLSAHPHVTIWQAKTILAALAVNCPTA